jgi:hypothetical protein
MIVCECSVQIFVLVTAFRNEMGRLGTPLAIETDTAISSMLGTVAASESLKLGLFLAYHERE